MQLVLTPSSCKSSRMEEENSVTDSPHIVDVIVLNSSEEFLTLQQSKQPSVHSKHTN